MRDKKINPIKNLYHPISMLFNPDKFLMKKPAVPHKIPARAEDKIGYFIND